MLDRKAPRVHKHKADYGIKDYREFYKKKYNSDITTEKYNKIIKVFNQAIIDLIIDKGIKYKIPFMNFELYVAKLKQKPKIVNGKLVNNRPINWKATHELWDKNDEAREKKLLIRYNNDHSSNYVFRIYMKKFKSTLRTRNYYKFKAIRSFKQKLHNKIMKSDDGSFDAYLLYEKK